MTDQRQFQCTAPVKVFKVCVGSYRRILCCWSKATCPVSAHPAVSSRIEECLCLWKDEMVFVYACLYVMSRFKSMFAGLTTMLCKLSLVLKFFFTYVPTHSPIFLIGVHYVSSLVEVAFVFACSPYSICLPGSWGICWKQEQAGTAPLCPTAEPEWPKKSQQ